MDMSNTRSVKRIQLILTILVLCFAIFFITLQNAYAAEEIASGTCGDNLTWTLDDEGVLSISGSGTMYDYEIASECPWYSSRGSIEKVIISNNVTRIGSRTFFNCSNLETFDIGDGVESIGSWALYNSSAIEELIIPASVKMMEDSSVRACTSLKSACFYGDAPSIGSYVFSNSSDDFCITVHTGCSGWDSNQWSSYSISSTHFSGELHVISEPTCTDSGLGQCVCSICGKAIGEETIPALGHNLEGLIVETEPTCEKKVLDSAIVVFVASILQKTYLLLDIVMLIIYV